MEDIDAPFLEMMNALDVEVKNDLLLMRLADVGAKDIEKAKSLPIKTLLIAYIERLRVNLYQLAEMVDTQMKRNDGRS